MSKLKTLLGNSFSRNAVHFRCVHINWLCSIYRVDVHHVFSCWPFVASIQRTRTASTNQGNILFITTVLIVANFQFLKVALWIPILFILICAFLVFMPIYVRPYEVAAGLLITATGIPAYLIGIYWENKPAWLKALSSTNFLIKIAIKYSDNLTFFCLGKATCGVQKLAMAVKEE